MNLRSSGTHECNYCDNVQPLRPILQDSSMSDFLPRLMAKVTELFPNLEQVDVLPYLLNSRAVSAYDAVMLLVHSVTSSFEMSEDPLNPCLLVSVCNSTLQSI